MVVLARFHPRGRRTHPVPEALSWWQSAAVLLLYGSILATGVDDIHRATPGPPLALAVPGLLGLAALAGARYVFAFGAARRRPDFRDPEEPHA